MWPFNRKMPANSISANVHTDGDGVVHIDVRGQTCPGYLLAINRAMDRLAPGSETRILTTYAPCDGDVRAWCREKGHAFEGLFDTAGGWVVAVRKAADE
jgi:TusA-related sulfurtransferase